MKEDIGTILNKGFSTWTRNLNICIPFILNFVVSGLVLLIALIVFASVFVAPSISGTFIDPESISPEQMVDIISSSFYDNLWLIGFGILILILVMTYIESFFTAGAIGMAQKALKSGDTGLDDMIGVGKQNAFNMFLVSILISLILLVGIVFIVPGIIVIDDFAMFLSDPSAAIESVALLMLGLVLWIIYMTVVSIVLSVVKYALVVGNLDPISSLESGFRFFMKNKLDVFLIWLILIALSVILSLVGNLFSSVESLAIIWTVINFIVSVAVIPPLVTLWWTRLYLDRMGDRFYDQNDLLLYP